MNSQFKNQALNNFVMESGELNLEERPYKGKVGGYSIEIVISKTDNVYDSFIYKKELDRDEDLKILMELLYN